MRWWQKYSELIEFVGLTIAAPCLVYGSIYGSLTPRTDGQAMVATALAVAGMVVWVARNH